MFPDFEKELLKNPFFQAWKKHSILGQLIAYPPILLEEFSEDWIKNLEKILGEGPLTPRLLALLAKYIEDVRKLEGYENIKKRLARLDDQLYPTLSEIQFISLLMEMWPSGFMHLEHTFSTSSGKNPELKVDYDSSSAYFEVTRILDYREMSNILQLFTILNVFQLSLMTLHGLSLEINVSFLTYPKRKMLRDLCETMNDHAGKAQFLFEEKTDDFRIKVTKGTRVVLNMPSSYIRDKIKDKMVKESSQFDKGDPNFVVLDATLVVADTKELADFVRDYFTYSQNDIIWGVFLMSSRWVFEGLTPVHKVEILHEPNPQIRRKDALREILTRIFSKKTLV